MFLQDFFGFRFDISICLNMFAWLPKLLKLSSSAGSPRSTIEAPHAFALRPSENWTARGFFVVHVHQLHPEVFHARWGPWWMVEKAPYFFFVANRFFSLEG